MCEDTVFWDLNYSMKYKTLVTGDILTRVLKVKVKMKAYNTAKKDNLGHFPDGLG